MSYPYRLGNHLSRLPVSPKISTRTSARKKYGIAWKKVAAGSSQSVKAPRRQPMTTPIAVPARKLRRVATPSSPSVQGRYEAIRLVTGAFSDHEKPRFPCTRFPRYCTYCTQRLVWTLKPSCSSIALIQNELQMPDD